MWNASVEGFNVFQKNDFLHTTFIRKYYLCSRIGLKCKNYTIEMVI